MTLASNIRVAAAVPVVRVADPKANAERIISLLQKAKQQGAQVVVTPELSLTGFTCGDLMGHPALLRAALRALDAVVDATRTLDIAVVVGLPLECERKLYNVAALVKGGEVVAVAPKRLLDSRDSRQFSSSAPDFKAVVTTPCGRALRARTAKCARWLGFSWMVWMERDVGTTSSTAAGWARFDGEVVLGTSHCK
jgi:predicted amidohydrolase